MGSTTDQEEDVMQLSLARWCTAALLVGAGIGPIVHVAFADGPDPAVTTENQRPGFGCGDENHEHTGPAGQSDQDSPCKDKDKDEASTDQPDAQNPLTLQPADDSKEKDDKTDQGNLADHRQDGDHRPETGDHVRRAAPTH